MKTAPRRSVRMAVLALLAALLATSASCTVLAPITTVAVRKSRYHHDLEEAQREKKPPPSKPSTGASIVVGVAVGLALDWLVLWYTFRDFCPPPAICEE